MLSNGKTETRSPGTDYSNTSAAGQRQVSCVGACMSEEKKVRIRERTGVEDALRREPLLEMLKPYHTASRAAAVDHRSTSSHFDSIQWEVCDIQMEPPPSPIPPPEYCSTWLSSSSPVSRRRRASIISMEPQEWSRHGGRSVHAEKGGGGEGSKGCVSARRKGGADVAAKI